MDNSKHINLSGFPLQIGLANAINSSSQDHGWSVLHQEHGWSHEITHESGFIDLVVENHYKTIVLNIECKRPQDSTWQFLLPKPDDEQRSHCKFWATHLSKQNTGYFNWLDLTIEPASYESEFCVVAGQDAKSRPMLERIAATVVSSTEALAQEEAKLLREMSYEKLRVYINVIATTAKLQVCKFDPKNIDLEKGTIVDAEYEDIPYLRFRKQLSPHTKMPNLSNEQCDYQALAKAKENTVIVIEASKLQSFLKEFKLSDQIGHVVSRGSMGSDSIDTDS